MVASTVAGISPWYRGRNVSLLSIGQKGRFVHVKMLKRKAGMKLDRNKIKNKKNRNDGEPLYKQWVRVPLPITCKQSIKN